MEKRYFDPGRDGFFGVYYPCKEKTNKAFIVMLGDSSDDRMAIIWSLMPIKDAVVLEYGPAPWEWV